MPILYPRYLGYVCRLPGTPIDRERKDIKSIIMADNVVDYLQSDRICNVDFRVNDVLRSYIGPAKYSPEAAMMGEVPEPVPKS